MKLFTVLAVLLVTTLAVIPCKGLDESEQATINALQSQVDELKKTVAEITLRAERAERAYDLAIILVEKFANDPSNKIQGAAWIGPRIPKEFQDEINRAKLRQAERQKAASARER